MNCSFCGCTEKECALMIVAPMQAWICDNCIQLCLDTVFKNLRHRHLGTMPGTDPETPQPPEQQGERRD